MSEIAGGGSELPAFSPYEVEKAATIRLFDVADSMRRRTPATVLLERGGIPDHLVKGALEPDAMQAKVFAVAADTTLYVVASPVLNDHSEVSISQFSRPSHAGLAARNKHEIAVKRLDNSAFANDAYYDIRQPDGFPQVAANTHGWLAAQLETAVVVSEGLHKAVSDGQNNTWGGKPYRDSATWRQVRSLAARQGLLEMSAWRRPESARRLWRQHYLRPAAAVVAGLLVAELAVVVPYGLGDELTEPGIETAQSNLRYDHAQQDVLAEARPLADAILHGSTEAYHDPTSPDDRYTFLRSIGQVAAVEPKGSEGFVGINRYNSLVMTLKTDQGQVVFHADLPVDFAAVQASKTRDLTPDDFKDVIDRLGLADNMSISGSEGSPADPFNTAIINASGAEQYSTWRSMGVDERLRTYRGVKSWLAGLLSRLRSNS